MLPGLLAALTLLPLLYLASPLAFDPVPWPDDSAFFLTGYYWLRSPFAYLMHSQAPFAPTYDLANFNTMPGMPLMLGAGSYLGLDGSRSIRLYGMLALSAWSVAFALWLRKRGAPPALTWLLALAAALSPGIRWGAMVVRPEIWQGLFWLLILMDLDGCFKRPSRWRIPLCLAAAAYFHFEAILWVAPTAIGVALLQPARPRDAFARLVSIGWRTAALLAPWLLYVLLHWKVFWIQMDTQFGRLEAHHPYLGSAYNWFHHLWLSLGNPAGYPKFFNVGKALTWGVLLAACGTVLVRAARRRDGADRAVGGAAVAGLAATFYLWATKPETWFTAMIHLALWPVAAIAFVPKRARSDDRKARGPRGFARRFALPAALAPLIAVSAGTALVQARQLGERYSWSAYHDWVDCIDRQIGARKSVWQPHWPDILVELAARRPERDYTRAVDFPDIAPLISAHAARVEAIVHSLYLEDPGAGDHTGGLRERDRYYLTDYPWIPFKEHTGIALGRDIQVCQRGPFWAAITLAPVTTAASAK